jgi:hypothetical protein
MDSFHGGPWTGVGDDLTGARPNGCSEAWWLTSDGTTEREEHGEPDSGLTGARAVSWRPGDDGEETAVEALNGGGAQAQRGEEESGDGCSEDCVRVSAFYRGQREAEAPGIQWLASMPVLKTSVRWRHQGRRFKAELRHRLMGG